LSISLPLGAQDPACFPHDQQYKRYEQARCVRSQDLLLHRFLLDDH